jgi:shikimate kinase
MNIVLIGYRGSGKSAVGKRLANELWKKFIDTDAEVCKRFGGMSIAEIWDRHGEPAFRETECQVAVEVLAKDEQVIALGGGTVMQPAAREALAAAKGAVRIYLQCEPVVLADRLAGDAATRASRPNLTAHGGGVAEIEAVLAEREPVYRQIADHELEVTRMTLDDVVRHIITRFL